MRETFALSDVVVVEVGSTRGVYVGTSYRLRLKRHADAGQMVRLNDGVPGAAALATPIVPPATPVLPRIELPPAADGTTDT